MSPSLLMEGTRSRFAALGEAADLLVSLKHLFGSLKSACSGERLWPSHQPQYHSGPEEEDPLWG